jgi:hypothetical protein
VIAAAIENNINKKKTPQHNGYGAFVYVLANE